MKNQKFLFLVIAAVVIFTARVFSASSLPENLSVLANQEIMRVEYLRKISRIEVGTYSSSQVKQVATKTVSFSPGLSSVEIGSIIDGASKFQIQVVSDDWVSTWVQLYGNDNQSLFSGGGSMRPVATPSGYVLPKIKNETWMNWVVPVVVGSDVVSARMIVKDPIYGWTTALIDLDVYNGQMQFRTGLAGKGILLLTTRLGEVVAYDLSKGGVKSALSTLEVTTATSFDGIVPLPGATIIDTMIESYNGVGQNKTFEVFESSNVSVSAMVYTSEGAEPTGYFVKGPGDTKWTFLKKDAGAQSVSIPMKAGTTYVVPEWDPNEFRSSDPTGGGGKGG